MNDGLDDDISTPPPATPAWSRPGEGHAPFAELDAEVSTAAPEPPLAHVRVRRRSAFAIVAPAIAALAGGLVGGLVVAMLDDDPGAGSEGTAARPPSITRLTLEQDSATSDAAARAGPSVIKIASSRRVNGGTETDVGSGVVIDDQGHVVTNAHVVLGTETLKAILADGSERQAILIAHDYPFSDVAVLQIGPGHAPAMAVGDSSVLRLGQTVIAMGNPLAEFSGSVSVGVISGLGRRRTFDAVLQDDLVQTDAALNHGNSGGALVNLRGEFIAMPTAILREGPNRQDVEGIGFALPSNRVMAIAEEIIRTRTAPVRPSLGLDHVDLGPEIVTSRRLNVSEGAFVIDVAAEGPSAEAGVAQGDVVVRIGDDDVNRDFPLLNALMKHAPGELVKVVLNRAGRIIELEVRLARRG